jgi:Glycosyl transferase family 2
VSLPAVTVITPTWQRHELLLNRAIPSVQAQGYPSVEHLVIGDGPDEVLRKDLAEPWLRGWRNLWYKEFPVREQAPHYGHLCRREGLEFASGAYITYCDDDDSLRPMHCSLLAAALDENPGAGFAVSRMVSHIRDGETVIGYGPLSCGNVGTPMVMHRKELAEIATWDHAGQFEDWDLVLAWINADVPYVRVDDETCDAWPSAFR